MKGGFQCTECFMPIHKRCKSKMLKDCGVWTKDSVVVKTDGKGNMQELSGQNLAEFSEAPSGITDVHGPSTYTDSQIYTIPRPTPAPAPSYPVTPTPTPTPGKDGPPNPGRFATGEQYGVPLTAPAHVVPAPVPASFAPHPAPAPGPHGHPAAGVVPGYPPYQGPPPGGFPGYPPQQQQQPPSPPAGSAPYSWGAPVGGGFAPAGYVPGGGYAPPVQAYPTYPPAGHYGPPPGHGQAYSHPTPPGYGPSPPGPGHYGPPAPGYGGYASAPPPAMPAAAPVIPRYGRADPIDASFERGTVLGKGAFSEVVKYRERTTGREWAVKIMKKNFRDPIALEVTAAEIGIYKSVGEHPNIVQLHDIYEDDSNWFLVIQLITGGELLHRITELKTFSERDASEFTAQMFNGIRHLHQKNIVHRDLKPENLLLSNKSADANILLTDFGLSKVLSDRHEQIFHPVGTPGYLSPELVRCMQHGTPYGIECDMWAAGVIIYIMLCGFPPFWGRDNNELFSKITSVHYSFPDPYWTDISSDAKNLIYHLLCPDPRQRFNIDQALAHPWISQREKLKTLNLEQAHQQLTQFNARRKLRDAITKVMILNRLGMTASQVMAAGSQDESPVAASST